MTATNEEEEWSDEDLVVDIPDEMQDAAKRVMGENVVYLSGPIRRADDGGAGWRDDFIEDFGDEFEFANPLDEYDTSDEYVDFVVDPADLDEDSEVMQITANEICNTDKMLIHGSDYIFVGLPDVISRGTMMECMYAYMVGKPVFVWIQEGQRESPWVYEHAEFASEERAEVVQAIRQHGSR